MSPNDQNSTDTVSNKTNRRLGRRSGRRGSNNTEPANSRQIIQPIAGRLNPLSAADIEKIHQASLDILEQVGMSEAPDIVIETITASGGSVTQDNRLTIPRDLVNTVLKGLNRGFSLFGQSSDTTLNMKGPRTHTGSGGAAPQMVDTLSGQYRAATLADLYDAARLVDRLEHIHFFSRSVVATDMKSERALDINTAFAALAGTRKHVMVSASDPQHVHDIAEMCFTIAGSPETFHKRPFLSLNINHAVPPLRFSAHACEVLAQAAELGLPIMINTFGQMGASSPVTIAGCLAQTNAETLAGMVFAYCINPNVKALYGARPMITDLRTGGMAGGSGEQAILTAAASQIAKFYNLPNSTIAGATDSKLPDAQSGYEKALTIAMAAQAGANIITQAAGTQAGLMATSFAAYVIDNDMLGTILKAAQPIEVSSETLSVTRISDAVRGDGHFLGQSETYQRMKSDFVYPDLADRRPPELWQSDPGLDLGKKAKDTALEILATHFPNHLPLDIQDLLRQKFAIELPTERMRPK